MAPCPRYCIANGIANKSAIESTTKRSIESIFRSAIDIGSAHEKLGGIGGIGMKVLTRSVWLIVGRCEADKDSADMVEIMHGTGRGLAGGSTAGLGFEKAEALVRVVGPARLLRSYGRNLGQRRRPQLNRNTKMIRRILTRSMCF